jgi:ATP/maltotriose-dependent transcriptional regulator MalT
LRSGFVLVLDDFHLVGDPGITTGLSYLVDYLTPKMHLVFISRSEPAPGGLFAGPPGFSENSDI